MERDEAMYVYEKPIAANLCSKRPEHGPENPGASFEDPKSPLTENLAGTLMPHISIYWLVRVTSWVDPWAKSIPNSMQMK